MPDNRFERLGVIGRFKPLHNGAYVMLESLCKNAENVVIGVGSSNKYNLRNPFTAKESEEMIRVVLSGEFDNFRTIQVPDFAHIPEYADGERWKSFVLESFGKLDGFVSNNGYVKGLLEGEYDIIHPVDLIPKDREVKLRSTEVRYKIASFDDSWRTLVPEEVSEYLEKNGLVERFRDEFGLQTLAYVGAGHDYSKIEMVEAELLHAREK